MEYLNDCDWLRTPAKCWASVRLETCRTSVKAESISIWGGDSIEKFRLEF